MKSNNLLIAFFVLVQLLLTATIQAQEVKKITQNLPGTLLREEYYILKSNKKIKEGPYTKITLNNKIVQTGYYKNNVKDSTWTEYFYGNQAPKSKGNYKNNLRTGVWEFYDDNRQVVQKYDFTQQKLLALTLTTEEQNRIYEVKTTNGIEKLKLNLPPTYIGGKSELEKSMLEANVRYPVNALRNGVSGTVLISFFIDENGQPEDFKVEKGIGAGCDEEALRVVKSCTQNWLPGQFNGQPVTAKTEIPVSFGIR